MNIDFCYRLFLDIIYKNTAAYIDPDIFNRFINQAQLSYMAFLLGEFKNYIPGRPVATVEIGMNQIVRQRLTPFIGTPAILVINASGFCAYPEDYEQVDAMYWVDNMQRVRWVGQEYLYSTLNSVIDPVEQYPIYLIEDGGFRFYPTTLGIAKLSYVKKPREIKWVGYKDAITGEYIYDSASSVDPLWNDVDMFEIIARALSMAGVAIQSASVSQFANTIKNIGQ